MDLSSSGEACGAIWFEEVNLYAIQKFHCGEISEQRPERHAAMRHRQVHLGSARGEADNWKAVFGKRPPAERDLSMRALASGAR